MNRRLAGRHREARPAPAAQVEARLSEYIRVAATAASVGLPVVILLAVFSVNADPNIAIAVFQVADPIRLAFGVGAYYLPILISVPIVWMLISEIDVPRRHIGWSWPALVVLGAAGLIYAQFRFNPTGLVILGATAVAGVLARWAGDNGVFADRPMNRRVAVALGVVGALLLSVAFIPPFPRVEVSYADGSAAEGLLVNQSREGAWLLVPVEGRATFNLQWHGGEIDTVLVCTGDRDPCEVPPVMSPPSTDSPSVTPSNSP